MATPREVISKIAAVLGIGVLCLPILLALMPVIEDSAEELRLLKTYMDVRRLSETLAAQPAGAPLSESDPWDQAYQVRVRLDGGLRVLSSGPNQSSLPGGPDEDDIYSDMPESPVKPIHRQKNRQSLFALGTMLAVWVSLSTLYLQSRS